MSTAGMEQARREIATAVGQLEVACGAALGDLHGEPHERRFWSCTIGPFLWQLACYVYDRAADPVAARPELPALQPSDLSYSCRDFVNRVVDLRPLCGFLDAVLARETPEAVAVAMVERCGSLQVAVAASGAQRVRGGLVARLRRGVLFWEGISDVVHYGAPFTHADGMKLALSTGGRIRRAKFPEQAGRLVYEGAVRRKLWSQLQAHAATAELNPLAQLSLPLAAFLMPSAFVEQYRDLVAASMQLEEGRDTRVVATAQGFQRSPLFALFAARVGERGGSIVAMQHGGFYGQMEETWDETSEHEQADVYCTWGYRHRDNDLPMPPPRLFRLSRTRRAPSQPRTVLWAMSARLNMVHVDASTPHYRRYDELNARGIEAMAAIVPALDIDLCVRPYPRTRHDPALEAWRSGVPRTRIDDGGGDSLVTHAARCAVLVFNFPGATGFLECIATDTPALIYCPEDLVPVHAKARAAYDRLTEVGLYVKTPEALMETLRARLQQGEAWWHAPEKQAARRAFQDYFARQDGQIVPRWRELFLKLADGQSVFQN